MENTARPKILHLLDSQALPLSDRYAKIFASLFEIEEFRFESNAQLVEFINNQEESATFITTLSTGFILKDAEISKIKRANTTIYYDNAEAKHSSQEIISLQEFFSVFNLGAAPATDLMRILHQHFHKKKTAGVYSLMEKGSLILGEKIQNHALIGTTLDQLAEHLSKTCPAIFARMHDIRQLITAMVNEAFKQSQELQLPYPTVDFQFAANAMKACFAIRFPSISIDLEALRPKLLHGESLPWFLAWRAVDYLLIKNQDNVEIEVKGVIFAESSKTTVPSILIHTTAERSAGKTLLSAPSQYSFALINEVKTAKLITISRDKLASGYEHDEKDDKIKILAEKLKASNKKLAEQKNEVLKTIHDYEADIDIWKKKYSDLLKKAEFLAEKVQEHQSKLANNLAEQAIEDSSQSSKILEKERREQAEKLQILEKRYGMLEQKCANLHKDLQAKEKELLDTKSESLKLKRDAKREDAPNPTNIAAAAGNAAAVSLDKETAAKIRDFEAKEAVFKQEIRKLNFKLESGEKNIKAIKDDHAEKMKVLEKKLEASKLKEMDLLKKLDDLGGLLKKATKAA